jgi:hypothetical protein
MAPNDEVLVDELRFGRMFQRLRRAGLYRRCGCAGCAPCAEAAKGLLRGVAQSGRFSGYYRPERWGERYRVYERPTHSGTVSVLTDMAQQPTVVDVNVASDDMPQEEFTLGDLLEKRLPPGASPDLKKFVRTELVPKVPGPEPKKLKPLIFLEASWDSPLPETSGLYVIQWNNGQYFGKADILRRRLMEHRTAMLRYGLNPANFQIYYAKLADPRAVEYDVLTAISKKLGGVKHFGRVGLTNRQTELEFL